MGEFIRKGGRNMFFKNKKENTAVQSVSAPVSSSEPQKFVNPDDFFKDMGRKRQIPKEVKSIDTPEVTGLREAPLAAPGSTIHNIIADEQKAEELADKTIPDPTITYGDINGVITGEMDVDAELAQQAAEKQAKKDAPKAMIDPEDFFRDMGRKKKEPKEVREIVTPEVTGLRENPAEAPDSVFDNIPTDESMTDSLADKTIPEAGVVYGDINGLDTGNIDLSSLRD